MRAAILAPLLLVSSIAVAQPTATKPDETAPTGTANVPTVKVTTKRFGPIKAGSKLSLTAIKKLFPKSKVTKTGKGAWTIANKATGLAAAGDSTKITVTAGPVEVRGVMIGDDGKELASALAGAYCHVEGQTVECAKDFVTLVLSPCSAQANDAGIPLAELAGCKVTTIVWHAVPQPE